MGCGTGVLAILARLKHANRVLAVDIDEWAYENTFENIKRNNVSVDVKKGGSEVLLNEQFDLILANINRNILMKDMESYCNALKHGGSILLSGFFNSDKEILLNEIKKYGLKLLYSTNKNDWTLLHVTR